MVAMNKDIFSSTKQFAKNLSIASDFIMLFMVGIYSFYIVMDIMIRHNHDKINYLTILVIMIYMEIKGKEFLKKIKQADSSENISE